MIEGVEKSRSESDRRVKVKVEGVKKGGDRPKKILKS